MVDVSKCCRYVLFSEAVVDGSDMGRCRRKVEILENENGLDLGFYSGTYQ